LCAPEPNGNTWWEVFGVAPSAPAEAVRAAYVDRLKQCHPNRVSKRAPEFILLAEEMTEKLNAAFEQFESRPSWWTE
jgi:DnaJ-domain-containing protein 1